jgi:hypothetical protein
MEGLNMTEVYKAIAAITGSLATVGIAKGRKNAQQGYSFRGIDDIYSSLSRLLADNGLCVIPRVQGRTVTEQLSKSGGTLFYAVVDVEFDLVSAKDGSKHTARVIGEAMDSGDKATNKAMSAAYKYFALQTFCIPTEGDNDADAHTHELAARQIDPRGDGHKEVPHALIADAVTRVRKVLDKDVDSDAHCMELYQIHQDLSRDSDAYIAVADALAREKVISKADWKNSINRGRDLSRKVA